LPMKEIVINCPGESHKEPRYNKLKEKKIATSKILLIVSKDAVGTIKIQCNDSFCKRSGGSNYNGWYEVTFNGLGGYTIKAVKRQAFDLEKVPIAVIGD